MNGFSTFILAQASSGVGEFARQVPIGLILMFCGSGVLLVVAAFVIIRARSQRNQALPPEPAFVPDSAAPRSKPSRSARDTSDLPDLDMLVSAPPVTAAPKPAAEAAPVRSVRRDTFTVNLNDGDAAQAVEVVTILRDVVDGGLIVQMGGQAYRDPTQDQAFRASFLKIMREIGPVVNPSNKPARPAAPPAPVESPEPESLRDLLTSPADMEIDDHEPEIDFTPRPASPPPPPAPDGNMPGDLPRFSLDDEVKTVKKRGGLLGRNKTQFVPVPELDLAGAIEAYLQHKLRHSPDYAGRSIHVHPSPDGGVAIEVDGEFYESVGDVTDADVRAFLSATIQEWQQRNAGK